MIKILLVDEQARIRRGLQMRLALEPDFSVLGETGDGYEALKLVQQLHPDVVITGIHLPGLDGISLTHQIRHDFPTCAVVILSLYDERANREQATSAGAAFFVSKQKPDSELVTAIRDTFASRKQE